jgi:hypothetical protein
MDYEKEKFRMELETEKGLTDVARNIIETLRARVEAAEKDTARLDWLEANVYVGFTGPGQVLDDELAWREAIDSCRAAGEGE